MAGLSRLLQVWIRAPLCWLQGLLVYVLGVLAAPMPFLCPCFQDANGQVRRCLSPLSLGVAQQGDPPVGDFVGKLFGLLILHGLLYVPISFLLHVDLQKWCTNLTIRSGLRGHRVKFEQIFGFYLLLRGDLDICCM